MTKDEIAALQRAIKKINEAYMVARRNGYTQPVTIELTIPELRELTRATAPGGKL